MKEIPESLHLLRLITAGAISIYESEVQEIARHLEASNDRKHFRALDSIASALYLSKEELENVLIPAAERE